MTEQETNPQPEPLTSTQPYQSGHTRATLTIVLLMAFVALSLVHILSLMLQLGLLEEAAAGAEISEERVAANDLRQGAVFILIALTFFGAVVAFCFWIHRAYRNLRALGNPPQSLEYSPGWAVGWFFIPLANLVMPYRVVSEIWAKSDPTARTREDIIYSVYSAPALVVVWWVSWLVSNIGERLASRFYQDARSPESLIWATKAVMFSHAVWIVSSVLAALVVRGIDRRQEARAPHVLYQPEAPPPPIFTPRPTPQP